MLAVVTSGCPSTTTGALSAALMRAAISLMTSVLRIDCSTTMNSSPHAYHDVFRAHRGADALGHLFQQFVAGLMTARVVDLLEAVQIQKQHRQHGAVALGLVDGSRQMVREVETIR